MNQKTPLYNSHVKHNAKFCSFAGYDMPIQYPLGVIKEHEWVRTNAGLFDVSHMGQALVSGKSAAEFFSTITPSSFLKTPNGRAKYTVLTNEKGGIIDDLIITRLEEDSFFVVFNAARKSVDIAWMQQHLPADCTFEALDDRALIALQGDAAESVLQAYIPHDQLSELPYMTILATALEDGTSIFVSRLGYTGEDGFEISIPGDKAEAFWDSIASHEKVEPIGLAARDSLRLEMGYPLYGHDLNEEISPIEANLGWVVPKTHSGFIGADRILPEKENGVKRKRYGIKLVERGIAREGAAILDKDGNHEIGTITSGGFSPSLKAAIGQGYIDTSYADTNNEVCIEVRGKKIQATIEPLSFINPKTKSMKKTT